MTCELTEIRRQLNDLQTLLDTYEHFHVDSVTPEEKAIVERTKANCINAIKRAKIYNAFRPEHKAIKAITDVE